MSRKHNTISSAWIITREGTENSREVLGLLSGRNSDKKIREYLEWTYALLYYGPEDLFALLRYKNKWNPYPAKSSGHIKNNADQNILKGASPGIITCGHSPWLVAYKGRNVQLLEDNKIKFKMPDQVTIRLEPYQKEISKIGEFVILPMYDSLI